MHDLRQPILPGKGASDYERYLRTDELLALQKLPEEFLHKDELTFQVVHQASELLLKGAVWELERASEHIAEGDLLNATRLIRRANQMLGYRSEEHTSELQSHSDLVCRLLLEKKKTA